LLECQVQAKHPLLQTKVLKGLVEKSPSSANWPVDVSAAGIRRPVGGLDALYHLLIRLDLSDWWSKIKQ
jgi:hypothetical protein